nr:hypothetical protein CTI12_AA361790 [Tanacetum cinerariifolium]
MGILKGYVRNQARPEGSIVTGYLAEELIEFGNDVVKGVENIGILHSRHEGRLSGVGTIGLRMIDPDRDALKVAHSVVLQHMTCITPYIEQHKRMLRATHRERTNKYVKIKSDVTNENLNVDTSDNDDSNDESGDDVKLDDINVDNMEVDNINYNDDVDEVDDVDVGDDDHDHDD